MRFRLSIFALVATVLALSRPLTSQEPAGWHGITTDGYASLSYTYNENRPANRINQFRVFDFNDEEPQLDAAQLVIQRAADKPNQLGFRFEMIAGSGVPEITASSGLFRDRHTGVAHHFDIPQMYARYVVPLAKGLALDAGKFATHMGYEVIGGYDGYNDNYTRSFLFGYGIPFTQTGARASYTFNSHLSAMASVTNGWDDFQRINHAVTWGAQLGVNPTATSTLAFNFIHGPERWRNDRDQRSVGEVVATWKATHQLTLATDALYGHEENGVMPGVDAIWKAIDAYATYKFSAKFSVALRGERFRDGGGTRTGTDQALNGYTVTPAYTFKPGLTRLDEHLKKLDGFVTLRGDLRWDHSDRQVFLIHNCYCGWGQFTAATNIVYGF